MPYGQNPQGYAWSTRLVPETCETPVVELLNTVREQALQREGDEGAFDVLQNAEVAADAERYYRMMVRGDRQSWNVRDTHMVDTMERLRAHLGGDSRGWEPATTPCSGSRTAPPSTRSITSGPHEQEFETEPSGF